MTELATKAVAMNAPRNDSGSAAPAFGAAAGALRMTAITGAIRAADSAMQFGIESCPLRRRTASGGPVRATVVSAAIWNPLLSRAAVRSRAYARHQAGFRERAG